MASSGTLREQVAEEMAVILSGEPNWGIPRETDEAWQLADAAIRVVLVVVVEQIAAIEPVVICGGNALPRDEVLLAVMALLGDGNAVPE